MKICWIGCATTFVMFVVQVFAQGFNPNYLRKDETLRYDEIVLKFDTSILIGRSLGLGLDRVRFFDAQNRQVADLDIGTNAGAYYQGEGWHSIETWADGVTMCWASGLAARSSLYFPLPRGATRMALFCIGPPIAIKTDVFLNGSRLGTFTLAKNSGWQTASFNLPETRNRHLDYHLVQGGPIQVSGIDWIDGNGMTVAHSKTDCELSQSAPAATFPISVPEGVGDFRLALRNGAPAASRVQVSANNANSRVLDFSKGALEATTTEPDALSRQANRKTRDAGWGEDFHARNTFSAYSSQYPVAKATGESLYFETPPGVDATGVVLTLAQPLDVSCYPYLSVKLKVSEGQWYAIRPEGRDAKNISALIWYEDAVTDDRTGTGDWEMLTFNLATLAREAAAGATTLTQIAFPLVKTGVNTASMELDWVRVHSGLLPNPEDRRLAETDFGNHLDDDGDGLTDRDDRIDYTKHGFNQPLVMAFYYGWFGSRLSTTKSWIGWAGEKLDFSDMSAPPKRLGIAYNPDQGDPQQAGKRSICSVYYPLNFRDYPDYTPAPNGAFRYDVVSGLEGYDSLNKDHVASEISLAARYGIDGFVALAGGKTWFGSYEQQNELALECAAFADKPFWITADYNYYYYFPPFYLQEEPDYLMALDLRFLSGHFGAKPRWLRYNGRPVITASFMAELIPASKWQRVTQLDPTRADLDGAVDTGTKLAGYGNKIAFTFAAAQRPSNGDTRSLSVVFDYIQFYDANLNPLSILDFGTTQARPHLLSGWSGDETWPDGKTWVWAQGTQRKAVAEVEIPATAQFIEVKCFSFPTNNSVTLTINTAAPVILQVTQTERSYFLRLKGPSEITPEPAEPMNERPFALFLSSREAAQNLDGYASYGPYVKGSVPLVSDPKPTIVTVGCGYDDRKIRYPGNFVDRENGVYYRRQWEKALAAKPDLVLINTWNEWAEGTIIEPTVEFGYKYLELTLTYALLLHGKMSTSSKSSDMDLTVTRYEVKPDADSEIRFRSAKGGTVTFCALAVATMASFQALDRGQPFSELQVDRATGSITVHVPNSGGDFQLRLSPLVLNAVRSPHGVTLRWASSLPDSVLDEATNLTRANWAEVAVQPVVNGNWKEVELPATNTAAFFRQKVPPEALTDSHGKKGFSAPFPNFLLARATERTCG